MPARHEGDAHDDEHAADDRGAERLHELERSPAQEQVGAHGDGQQHGPESTEPGEQRQQDARQSARGFGKVLLDSAAGADSEVREHEAQHEQQGHHPQPDGVGRTSHAVGDRRLDHLHGGRGIDRLPCLGRVRGTLGRLVWAGHPIILPDRQASSSQGGPARRARLRSVTTSSSWDMPLRTRLVVRAIARERGAISSLTLEQIPLRRAWTAPTRPPYSWITGPVRHDVSIGSTAFRARDGHSVAVRTYRPRAGRVGGSELLPVLVWFHGGGWVLGNASSYDPLCTALAHGARVLVLSIDYRLAPDFRAPQAALDCVDAVRWVAGASPALGARPDGIGVAGDSAGGNLAAVVTQVVRDEGGADITHQSLVYPAVDATMAQPSVTEHAAGAVITRADMDAFLLHYLGEGAGALDHRDPLVSPLYAAELAGLPPALVQTADLDPLRDEGAAYARALREAGVEVRHTNYPRAPHGFLSFPGAAAGGRAAREELIRWVGLHAHRPSVG